MASKGNRQGKTLRCTVCKSENKRTERNIKNTTDKLSLNIFCPKCGKHTLHTEKNK